MPPPESSGVLRSQGDQAPFAPQHPRSPSINVAPFVVDPTRRLPGVPPKLILMHEGVHDNVVPNVTTDNLALAMGLPDAKATLGCMNASGCNGIWRFVMTEYGQAPDSGHVVTVIVPQASEQARRYLLSDGTEINDASP